MEIIKSLSKMEIEPFLTMLTLTYGAVVVAMIVDFISGVRKARKSGIATRSRGYKMTCEKASKYFMPMVVLSCVDIICSPVVHLPVFTMLMGSFNVFCEWKSVMESTHEKEEIRDAASTLNLIIRNKDDIAAMIVSLMRDTLYHQNGKEEKK